MTRSPQVSLADGKRSSHWGHCDDRGTEAYNLALGEQRATAARDYLISLGVPESRIRTISYGKERPFCEAQTENCWQQNRRDHVVVTAR